MLMQRLMGAGRRARVVLLVDDNEIVRKFICAVLGQSADWEILTAVTGDQALAISRSFLDRIDLVISDIDMPGMNGLDLCQILARERPDIGVLLISGLPLVSGQGGVIYLPKPFSASALKGAIDNAVQLALARAGSGRAPASTVLESAGG